MSRTRYGTAHRVDRDRGRKRVTLPEAIEAVPSHPTATPPPTRQPALPDPGGCGTESGQRPGVAGDPGIREVAHKLLTQGPVLGRDRLVAVPSTPFRQGFQSAAEAALGRLRFTTQFPFRERAQ